MDIILHIKKTLKKCPLYFVRINNDRTENKGDISIKIMLIFHYVEMNIHSKPKSTVR